jgi:hypothetical protein
MAQLWEGRSAVRYGSTQSSATSLPKGPASEDLTTSTPPMWAKCAHDAGDKLLIELRSTTQRTATPNALVIAPFFARSGVVDQNYSRFSLGCRRFISVQCLTFAVASGTVRVTYFGRLRRLCSLSSRGRMTSFRVIVSTYRARPVTRFAFLPVCSNAPDSLCTDVVCSSRSP